MRLLYWDKIENNSIFFPSCRFHINIVLLHHKKTKISANKYKIRHIKINKNHEKIHEKC